VEPLPCLSHFECTDGRVHRGYLFKLIFAIVFIFLIIYFFCAVLSQWITLKTQRFGQSTRLNPARISDYFRKRNPLDESPPGFQLNIYLNQAKLRDVTRFDPERNEGFSARIMAGRITALMGGSGCGKSSLLDTIHGRRRLLTGAVRFAQHEPLSNELSDCIGYVPQADIMHEDLTLFETVYYSARTRRLGDRKSTIKQDVCFVLEKLGLNNMHNSMTKTLSGGKRNCNK
jgi:ABC-type bacteriocin/lantibiotic exporter with double-glycine peptidase domain